MKWFDIDLSRRLITLRKEISKNGKEKIIDYDNLVLSFKYNTYRVLDHEIEELRQDERAFAPVVLAARMVMARTVKRNEENISRGNS
jgi:DNA modification methylase